ncbi:CocE/NonD family hydrolase [Streptomyces sp. CB01881]|uniref:CocE/NonD family hydrolase n=1 Tax=Streptomyces sp. CB01881 TaxID=2078691 RepID=UPI000CDC82D1|nr:CocE/NonD family hydrolase [Streptomyces sp. CB01881]AUY52325.1 peptidase S15 [Streptomyces sp. CB01881]TYC71745.1 CocE/NonD family hydrolase [Streptomyces sp. CB01881]
MPSYPYRTIREDLRVPLPDGTGLYARLWRPVTDDPVPALLEYSAGRLTDWTASDDARRHPWYAGHGYASARVDRRGHGNSGGTPGDATDLPDGAAVLAWLAGRPWCSGRIGLLGTGPAGATALRLAAHAPDAVHAVVAACPETGLRPGGAVPAADLHARATAHLADAARPPDPQYLGDDWRPRWQERLASLEPPFPGWLADAPPDDPPATAAVPTLAVAGWGDPSCALLLRLLASGAVPVRAVLGPWPHGLPDEILPETLRWWDHWLRDIDAGALKTPVLRSWISTRWTGEEAWPSPDVRDIHYGLDGPLRTAGTASDDRHVQVRSPQHTGLNAGAYVPAGRPADQPPDQREEDGRSVCFDSQPLPEPLELLGTPSLRLRLRPSPAPGLVVARLCDVAPDGTSVLLTRGALVTSPSEPDATVELAAAGTTVPPGHRLRLALSSAYWPWLWPDPDPAGFGLDPSHSTLTLPVRHLAADSGAAPVTFASPTLPFPPPVHTTEPLTARPERLTIHDIARHEWRTELSPAADGTRTHPDGLVRDEHTVTAYRILTATPTSAQARTDRTVRLERPAIGWDITLQTRTELRCTPTHFLAHTRLTALEAGDVVFTRDWQQQIPRESD